MRLARRVFSVLVVLGSLLAFAAPAHAAPSTVRDVPDVTVEFSIGCSDTFSITMRNNTDVPIPIIATISGRTWEWRDLVPHVAMMMVGNKLYTTSGTINLYTRTSDYQPDELIAAQDFDFSTCGPVQVDVVDRCQWLDVTVKNDSSVARTVSFAHLFDYDMPMGNIDAPAHTTVTARLAVWWTYPGGAVHALMSPPEIYVYSAQVKGAGVVCPADETPSPTVSATPIPVLDAGLPDTGNSALIYLLTAGSMLVVLGVSVLVLARRRRADLSGSNPS
jgi:LPXTG-motif cell wall-anchored protein